MARKITMNGQSRKSVAEVFEDFVLSQMAQGLSDITIATYRHHIHSISNHLDIQKPMEALTRKDLEAMIVSMRASGLAHNSISSYCRVFRTFSNWCRRAGLNIPELPKIKDKETVKEAYTDAELLALLKRPNKNCSFCEYRNWAIANFLMNSGCRSASIRNIQNRDVDLDARQVILRHNKNGKIQTVPLCSQMVSILREYMPIRGGKSEDYLFCDQYGGMMSMNGLRLAIARHNQSRGVEKTSAHLYRHTFARKYLVDCGGDAFMLQRLLGHSTLNGHEWQATIHNRSKGKRCPYCSNRILLTGFNDLNTVNPNLAKEWNYEKNIGLTPMDVMPNSGKKVWWKCNKGHEWHTTIDSRNKGHGCPYCSGRYAVLGESDLATQNPELAKEWHPTRNEELTPWDVLPGSRAKVWWQCEHGHEWQAIIRNRSRGIGCPICAKKKQ